MSFEILKPVKKEEKEQLIKRITQRNLIPKAVKLRNSEIYQLGDETIIVYDKDNSEVFRVNQTDKRLEFGDPSYYIDYSTGDAYFNSINAPIEAALSVHIADFFVWENRLTDSAVYVDIAEADAFDLNFSKYSNYNAYFQIIAKTDDGTAYYQLYNKDASAAVTSSEVSTASTSTVTVTSGAITKPTGTATLAIQHKKTGGAGGNYANLISARIIFD